MSFTINTNISSLQAQQYLNVNGAFQAKTISRVTSGLRIVSSGDDAAGLAVANGYRSDQAVLSQGVRNANDGLSQLQIVDGGINNISQLLDRARTLATQSASGTFTGDRTVLNSEFQSVVEKSTVSHNPLDSTKMVCWRRTCRSSSAAVRRTMAFLRSTMDRCRWI